MADKIRGRGVGPTMFTFTLYNYAKGLGKLEKYIIFYVFHITTCRSPNHLLQVSVHSPEKGTILFSDLWIASFTRIGSLIKPMFEGFSTWFDSWNLLGFLNKHAYVLCLIWAVPKQCQNSKESKNLWISQLLFWYFSWTIILQEKCVWNSRTKCATYVILHSLERFTNDFSKPFFQAKRRISPWHYWDTHIGKRIRQTNQFS